MAEEVREGLTASEQKTLPSKYLYDEVGSTLFEAICYLPEYYLTRTETQILESHAMDMVTHLDTDARLVELGAGSALKTRILIRAMLERHAPLVYCPIDISDEAMRIAEANITSAFPDVDFKGVIGDWFESLERLTAVDDRQKLILFLGSSIGNLEDGPARDFLKGVTDICGPRDKLLIGSDLAKDPSVLVPAYDDAAGVTAAFDMNILVRLNQELGAHFDTRTFHHEARWNPQASRMEMHLVSDLKQTVHIDALDMDVHFDAGETIHTENSNKYTLDRFRSIVEAAGLRIEQTWTDPDQLFALHLLVRAEA